MIDINLAVFVLKEKIRAAVKRFHTWALLKGFK
jgi:hypothetical protein